MAPHRLCGFEDWRDNVKTVIYPGTFDPITNGHVDIIKRAAILFDKVIVAIAQNIRKKPMFSVEERCQMIRSAVENLENIEVDSFKGLLVDYARSQKAQGIIRGLRAISDFEYEFQMALTNRKLNEKIETIFLMPNEAYSYLSSTLIKEAASLGADIGNFVPAFIEKKLKEKLRAKTKT